MENSAETIHNFEQFISNSSLPNSNQNDRNENSQIENDFFVNNVQNDNSENKINNDAKTDSDEDKWIELWNCKICFERLNEPIVTQCGHMFCWTCCYQWYTTKNPSNLIFIC